MVYAAGVCFLSGSLGFRYMLGRLCLREQPPPNSQVLDQHLIASLSIFTEPSDHRLSRIPSQVLGARISPGAVKWLGVMQVSCVQP